MPSAASSRFPILIKAMLAAVMESRIWLSPFLSFHREDDSVPSTSVSLPSVRYSDKLIWLSLLLRTTYSSGDVLSPCLDRSQFDLTDRGIGICILQVSDGLIAGGLFLTVHYCIPKIL